MKFLQIPIAAASLVGAILALTSCDDADSSRSGSSSVTLKEMPAESKARLGEVFVTAAAASPVAIHEARKSAVPGETITLEGRLMGRTDLFVDGRAVFVVGDNALLTACNEIPGDECETPWDACCDSKEIKREAIATIQINDSNGRVLPVSVRGYQGLTELSRVTVEGTVAKHSTPEAFIVDAERIHILP